MIYNFCTIVNKKYLLYGLGLYYSLAKQSINFRLFIFTFDNYTFDLLNKLKLPHLTPVALKDFEDKELLRVKQTRTISEYCWTCSSSTVLYCLKKFNLPSCTYVDADLFFFSSPQSLIDELGSNSISLSEHHYAPDKEQEVLLHGKYCVQFMTFKNDERGLAALEWWRERCLEWCYNRVEDGKFGDQKYLDDWLERFPGTYVIKNGGAIASWNVDRYDLSTLSGQVLATEKENNTKSPVIFYHYHNSQLFLIMNRVKVWGYIRNPKTFKILYRPYARALTEMLGRVRKIDPGFQAGFQKSLRFWLLWFKELLPQKFKGAIKKSKQKSRLVSIVPEHPDCIQR